MVLKGPLEEVEGGREGGREGEATEDHQTIAMEEEHVEKEEK
jgi:hypothetical protein